ncbi:MAG TPA: hypothetical protein VE338_09185 [Ktedonobacterales bacterium]|jgi:hypothetical protein|nr:hypothetical protein [Ktedonobacterales bacterium]
MVIASAERAFATSPLWLQTLGQIAGTLLLVELLLALAIVCALMGGLAFAAWWLHRNVIPVVNQYGEQAQHVMDVAGRNGERIVERVATFHGAQIGLFKGLRVFLFGRPRPEQEVAPLAAKPTPPAPRALDHADRGSSTTVSA